MSRRSWEVVLAAQAQRDLDRLPDKVATAVVETFDAIAANPQRLGKPLQLELAGHWSARRGPYRVIYRIDEPSRTVTVVAVGHRADVYRPR